MSVILITFSITLVHLLLLCKSGTTKGSNCGFVVQWSHGCVHSYLIFPISIQNLRADNFYRSICPYGLFHPGGEWLLKNVSIFFYGDTNISLKIKTDSKQPTCIYQLRFSRGLFFRTFTCWTCLKPLVNLANKCNESLFFGQVHQVL